MSINTRLSKTLMRPNIKEPETLEEVTAELKWLARAVDEIKREIYGDLETTVTEVNKIIEFVEVPEADEFYLGENRNWRLKVNSAGNLIFEHQDTPDNWVIKGVMRK